MNEGPIGPPLRVLSTERTPEGVVVSGVIPEGHPAAAEVRAGLLRGVSAPTEVVIDPNVRLGAFGHLTFSSYDDVTGPMPKQGQVIRAVEVEEGISALAVVAYLDHPHRFIYLAVAWREFDER